MARHYKPGLLTLFLLVASTYPTDANFNGLRRLQKGKPVTSPPVTSPPVTSPPVNPGSGVCGANTALANSVCTQDSDCGGTCGGISTNFGALCSSDGDCLPNKGKNKGTCNGAAPAGSCIITPTTSPPTSAPVTPAPATSSPTNQPTNQPTSQPTNAPTNQPTSQPTEAPTKQPTNQPVTPAPVTLAPVTSAPVTSAPASAAPTTESPTSSSVTCPPVGTQVELSSGSVSIHQSSIDTICGVYISTGSSLIPFARSYDSKNWESAPGPRASSPEGIACSASNCSIQLPVLQNASHKYVLLSKNGSAADREKIARFLEFTTFGPKMSEIDAFDDGSFDEASRAQYLKNQMGLAATSHREYYRKRTNSKWDASTQNARSNNPCSPFSKWIKYTYTRQDRQHTINDAYVRTTFEVVPAEANLTTTIYEADSRSDVSCNVCDFKNVTTGNSGFSGTGYLDIRGTNDFISWSINSEQGVHPISFRFSNGSRDYNRNRKLDLYVNDVFVQQLDFWWTSSWSRWKYSDTVDVSLVNGLNTIKLLVVAQNDGPNIDHLRVGKPAAVVLKTNGWPRTVAKYGVSLSDTWYPDLVNEEYVTFQGSYPEPPQYPYDHGRLIVTLPNGQNRYLDIGNPTIEFDGYEQYLPQYYFNFTNDDIFVSTSSHLSPYPMEEGQEFLLQNGLNKPSCDLIPSFAEEFDAPVFGKLPSGEWLQFTPTIAFEDNGPSINDAGDISANVLSDGGGATYVATNEKVKCANAARSIFNEDTCFLSRESTACSSYTDAGEITIVVNTSNIKTFYDISERYVYAIRGLVKEQLNEHPCKKDKSRWLREAGTTCSNPTPLAMNTTIALEDAFSRSSDKNELMRDVSRRFACDASDEVVVKVNMVIQIGADCYTHVHPDEYSVYDFSGWVTNHPGGEYNIMKWAQGWEGVEGWYLDFPFEGNSTRKIPQHPMSRWENNKGPPYIEYVKRLGDSILYRDLSNSLKTNAVAEFFGATSTQVLEGGVVICGSVGEVSNDPSLYEVYDVRSNEVLTTTSDTMNNQKQVIWSEVAKDGTDQLRQRMAWALAQIITTVPANIDAYDRTEAYLIYYDVFVRHAFGNFRNILSEVSYSPLMAEHLSYLRSKSHAYVYNSENKRVSSADENYAREVMQLFTIGLLKLKDDGSVVVDGNGAQVEVYSNEDIESFARAWTGFDRAAVRGNIEEGSTSANRVDPMQVIADYRDAFPKSGLGGASFIGDGYVLCQDLPSMPFLKSGARYRLLGGSSSPEMMKDPSYFTRDATYNFTRAELDPSSSLYQRLHNGGNYEMNVVLESDLTCTGIECQVDTFRVVKVGSVFFEYIQRPCVQLAFYNDGKQIQLYDNYRQGQMCANPALPHARSACCREERYLEVSAATMELGVGYFYDGERTTYPTARDRCSDKDLCVYESITVLPKNDWFRKGYHWTNKDCAINVKINGEGYIAIVHDIDSSHKNTVPYHVEETNTLNWFRVFWDGTGEYPGSSQANDCASNQCKVLDDGSCLCKASVTESTVFESLDGLTKSDIFSNVFIGSIGPAEGSTSVTGDGFKAHVVAGSIDESTVFEVQDKGRTLFFKNIRSTVSLQGWQTLPPQIYEAESATALFNVTVMSDGSSASRGSYVDYGTDGSFVEWDVTLDVAGPYLLSFRYALDTYPRPLSLFVNGQEVNRPQANPTIPIEHKGNDPTAFYPLGRCLGDCDNDSQCADGLICHQNDGIAGEEIPGCGNYPTSASDYCVDPNDYTQGVLFMPTGGWNDDWLQTPKVEVSLVSGVNTIRLQIPTGYRAGPNIDFMKIESAPSAVSSMSFRNPPHFMSLISDYSPYGVGEQTIRDAEYETAAVLDHYFYQDNVAPFLCIRIMQRFGISNPSPRYVSNCAAAFRTGRYESGFEVFGDDEYGSLESTLASILLDSEATSSSASMEPSHGALREPILQVLNLLRSMEYQTKIPDTLDGPPMENNYHLRLWKIDEKIGQGPYEFPTVFSFFLPEYIPDSGPVLQANLASPESMLLTMPNTISLLNGMFSLIKYGLSDCNSGFSTSPGYGNCNDNGLFQKSYGHLTYSPNGATVAEYINDMALLLTADRLSDDNRAIIEDECSAEPDNASIKRCIQQLIVSTGEFHSTSRVTKSGEGRTTDDGGGGGTEPYKAIVYFYLSGGCDSFNMLAPFSNTTCSGDPGDTVYDRYRSIRGKSEIAEGVGLPTSRLHEIQANNADQPCTSFGIHENLSVLKNLYDQGQVTFVANAGLLAKPVDTSNYRGETPVQLFAHNAMTLEAAREDLSDEFSGTGVGGRIADVLTQKGIKTNTFSISGQQMLLTGEPGAGPSQFILSSSGLSAFNANPSIPSMNNVIKALNNATTTDSGFFAETWSSKLTDAIDKQELLKTAVDNTAVSTPFPNSGIGNQLKLVTRLMQTAATRGVSRDIFYVTDGGYDTHSNVDLNLVNNFARVNAALQAFVDELKVLNKWESTVMVQFSEFARTLDPNTGEGTDHGWGGNHFMMGGSLNGGKVLGIYPNDFEQHEGNPIALSRGRMLPTSPWDSMWKGTAEWFGVSEGAEMDKVLPMHMNFPSNMIYGKSELFVAEPAAAGVVALGGDNPFP